MEMPVSKTDRHYTYGDYLTWPEGERWELIEGRAYALAPAPLRIHQRVLASLSHLMLNYFEGKICQVYFAPFDVRLPSSADEADDDVDTVVQPDLLVVCDEAKLDDKGVRGAPDLVIEILSESTANRDMGEKLLLYEKHGVRCYIIVDPRGKMMTARYLDAGGKFGYPENFFGNTQMPIRIFEGLVLDLARVFDRN